MRTRSGSSFNKSAAIIGEILAGNRLALSRELVKGAIVNPAVRL
jgi:hypothetical protein